VTARWRRMRLSSRLTLSFVLVIIISVLIMVVVANQIAVRRYDDLSRQFGIQWGTRIAPSLASYYSNRGSWEGVEALLSAERGNRGTAGPAAQGLAQKRPAESPAIPKNNTGPAARMLLFDAQGKLILDSAPDQGTLKITAKQIEDHGIAILLDDEPIGTLLVDASLGRLSPAQRAQTQSITTLLLLAGLAAAVGVAAVSELQTRNILRPVRALVDAANHLAEGDLSQRLPVETHDELGEMAHAFNTMASKLEEQNALRRRTTADIAHELRTPLSVLQIELESLEDGLVEPDSAYLSGLQQEVRHLGCLIDDLRILSLADAGELALQHEQVDVAWLVRSTVRRIQDTARSKQISLQARVDEQTPMVQGDAQRLAQVLLNLLTNAINHTPPGGSVSASARSEPGRIVVSVQDTGTGISQADLPHIFERLYRADRSRSRVTGGSGLGLSIAKSLVEAHGGEIWALSAVGEGTTISFSLPLDTPSPSDR